MYRPNRIGPHMLVHLDQIPKNFGTLNAAHDVAQDIVNFVLPDQLIRTRTASRAFYGTTPAIAAGSFLTVGVAINGAHPVGVVADGGSTGYLLTVVGQISVRQVTVTGEVDINMIGVVARADAAALEDYAATFPSNVAAKWFPIPTKNNFGQLDGMSASFKETVLIGFHDGDETYDADPLMAGFIFHNTDSAAQTLSFRGAVSMHKWDQDLDAFDPYR